MTDLFDWHSDDHDAWDSPTRVEDPEDSRRSTGRLQNGLLIATAVALFLVVAISTGQGVSRTVDVAISNAQSDLLSANRLILQTTLDGDVELYSQLLSRQDLQWHSDQRVIVRRQLFHDRAPLALWLDRSRLAASEAPFRDAAVTLAPDLNSAEVTTSLPYLALTVEGDLKSIRLGRIAHYQWVANRWILAPSAGEPPFQEETELVFEGDILRLLYPERDQEVGRRLATDVDAILRQLCRRSTALSCAPDTSLEVTLSAEPSSLLELDRAFLQPRYRTYRTRSIGSARGIVLPAPSLVGIAVDETGYQALFRGYASWLATAFIYQQIDPSAMYDEGYLAQLASVQLTPPPPGEHNPLLALEPLPIPLPEQKIQVHCTYNSGRSELWLYDPETDIWSGEPVITSATRLAMGAPAQEVVSPDGRLIALASEVDRMPVIELRHRDGRLVRRLSNAEDPFWLDTHRLGYIRSRRLPLNEQPAGVTLALAESDLVVVTLDNDLRPVGETILSSGQLREAVNLYRRPQGLRINDVITLPRSSERLFILARAASGLHDAYLFTVDQQFAEIEFLDRWRDNGSNDLPLQITADGRFLTVTRYSFSRTYISIYDVTRRSRQMITVAGRPFARSDWSADQQWLVIATDRLLWFAAPGFGYALTIPHNIAGCWSATWVTPGDG